MNQAAAVTLCCSATLYKGASAQMYVSVIDEFGQTMYNQSVQWSHGNNGVAAITGSGHSVLVQAVNVGTTTIYATVGGITRSVTLTVIAAPTLTTIQIQNGPIHIQMPYAATVTAEGYDQYGNQMSGITFNWSIANTAVATVNSSGTVTPISAGNTLLTASAGVVSGNTQLAVAPSLDANLAGPYTIWSTGYYVWSVSPSGGTGSYTYQWYVDYAFGSYTQALSTSDQTALYVDENTGPFAIRVVVTSGGSTAEAGNMVCNFIAGAHC